jgi:hypothetical protein
MRRLWAVAVILALIALALLALNSTWVVMDQGEVPESGAEIDLAPGGTKLSAGDDFKPDEEIVGVVPLAPHALGGAASLAAGTLYLLATGSRRT